MNVRLRIARTVAVVMCAAWACEIGVAGNSESGVSVIPAPVSAVAGKGSFVVNARTRVVAVGGGGARSTGTNSRIGTSTSDSNTSDRSTTYTYTYTSTSDSSTSNSNASTTDGGSSSVSSGADEPLRIANYFSQLVARTSAISLSVEPEPGVPIGGAPRGIVFRLDSANATDPEKYTLDVSTRGIVVSASDPRGLFYGGVTLWQLITVQQSHNGTVRIPATHIEDAPRFAWRGLMLDVARHYMPPAFIKQMLDWMALHKLNTFHWHLTDDQGWRLEIKKYPRLTEVGAWRVPAGAGPAADIDAASGKPRLYGGFYTQDEVRDIVRYAADRFITVVPEIEMPGHAQAAIAAYPQLGTEGPTPPVSSDWGVHTYLYNVDESTFSVLEDVLTEVMALFPGRYIHVGGDEAVKDRWRASPRVQQRMRELGIASETALQSYFTHRMERFLSAHGRKLIGWDEILEGGLPTAATVMSWRGTDGAVEAASGGHDVVMAPAPDLYLDYLQSDSPNEPPGRPRYITLADMYKFNVLPAAIGGDASRHVIGAQLNAWTEHMRTSERVQHAVFPRLAAFAEVVWSGPARRDWSDFSRRLPAQFARYEKLGVRYADSAYEVRFAASSAEAGGRSTAPSTVRVELSNQINSGEIRYTLDGKAPTLESPSYGGPLTLRLPATVTAATFIGQQRVSVPQMHVFDRASLLRRSDEELKSCANKLVLRLEDDAPRDGQRAVFNVDILDPCWVLEKADLSRITGIAASVGQLPFNFQVGDDVKKIPLYPPQTAAGELEVRVDSCEGERIALLPLAPASGRNGVTVLPRVPVTKPAGSLAPPSASARAPAAASASTMAQAAAASVTAVGPEAAASTSTVAPHPAIAGENVHDLCLRFTRRGVDPLWAIDSVQLFE